MGAFTLITMLNLLDKNNVYHQLESFFKNMFLVVIVPLRLKHQHEPWNFSYNKVKTPPKLMHKNVISFPNNFE
jgi:hypothetical protein